MSRRLGLIRLSCMPLYETAGGCIAASQNGASPAVDFYLLVAPGTNKSFFQWCSSPANTTVPANTW